MRTGTIIAETSDLSIGYKTAGRTTTVLANLNLTARHGELVALIGRNGTGKSTLLRTMVALQPPLSGTVMISGNDVFTSDRSSLPRVVSFASTEPFAMHNIKVREVVALGRFPYTNWIGSLTSVDEMSVNEALEATGLMPLADRIIDNISDGEKQRALIARSLAQDTRLLVMDEPTAYLDLPSRYSIVSLLKKLTRERGKCVIYSTHDLDTAINEADKIWLMNEKGVDEGAPEDLMLSRTIARAFESPLLSFSQTSGTFSFVRKRQGTITLDATGSLRKITERALHRCGYRTEPDAAVRITAGETDGRTEWCLMYEGRTECFSSIYDLVCHLPEED